MIKIRFMIPVILIPPLDGRKIEMEDVAANLEDLI
jgi:hypothetical protein